MQTFTFNLRKYFTYIIAPAVFCWCLFSLQACKEPIIEDTNLLTGDDDLGLAKDTLHTKVYTDYEQAVAANNVTVGVLGTISDVNFGNTYAGFYAQCQLTSNNISFGESPVLDSVVLSLKYNGTYGKFDQPVTVSVYELSQMLNDSTSYKTNDAFSVNIPPIGQVNGFTPNVTDSVSVLNGTFPPNLRISLSSTFGNKILQADTNVLRDNSSFLNLFKGFYVTTASSLTGNGLAYIDLRSSVTGITMYYHNNYDDSLYYTLPISGVTVNHFDNVYTGTPVATTLNNPSPAGEQKMYIQAGCGLKGKILITDLDSLPKNIAINKAEIILSQPAQDTQYTAPLVLNLYRVDDAGKPQLLEDDGSDGFGGTRITENVDGISIVRYRFNIKRYFQKLLQGVYSNKGFYLQSLAPNSNSERVVIDNSASDKNYQITILVTYTKL